VELLETLAENRDLQPNIKEAEQMLTQVDVTKFASYGWGMRAGIEKGRHEGIEKGRHEGILLLLSLQLKQRFGELPDATLQRMVKLTTQHLELLATAMSGFAGPASLDHWLTEVERGKRLD
jgi:predicted transposase YdaD